MRKLLSITVLAVVTALVAIVPPTPASARFQFHDPDVPVPLTDPLPFPWGTIEGIWRVRSNNHPSMFSFQVQSTDGDRKVLKVYEISAANGAILAEGTGFAVDGSGEVRAAMVRADGAGTYLLFIGLYEDKNAAPGAVRRFTVLRMRDFVSVSPNTTAPETTLVINKISETPMQEAPSYGSGN